MADLLPPLTQRCILDEVSREEEAFNDAYNGPALCCLPIGMFIPKVVYAFFSNANLLLKLSPTQRLASSLPK